jgi:hypothetical protein
VRERERQRERQREREENLHSLQFRAESVKGRRFFVRPEIVCIVLILFFC